MKSITLGDVEITQILEQPNARLPRTFAFPDTDIETWRANEAWLAPDFWDPASDELVANFQTWLVRSKRTVILVDTGAGNGKERPYLPVLAHLNTPFLDNLAAAGVHPGDVDVVVCTHLHSDHVGWNTQLVDRTWVPTFPNARYLFARADFDYWNPDNGHTIRSGRSMQNVFEPDATARPGPLQLLRRRRTPSPRHSPPGPHRNRRQQRAHATGTFPNRRSIGNQAQRRKLRYQTVGR
jgi:glyoxylase-like metal-dependent hydrolase (beta-lactamase superfamily II)